MNNQPDLSVSKRPVLSFLPQLILCASKRPDLSLSNRSGRHKRHGFAALLVSLFALGLTAGCVSDPGPFAPVDTTKFTLENTDRFVLLDRPAQHSVTCTGLQERPLADGRLEVVANVKNREARRIQVQINCVFKDEQGFSTGDETPWQTLILSENSTEAVRFTAMNTLARKYTVRVRQAR